MINPDLAKWAESFGAPLVRVDEIADLDKLSAALQAPGPMIALIRTSLEAVLPSRAKAAAMEGALADA